MATSIALVALAGIHTPDALSLVLEAEVFPAAIFALVLAGWRGSVLEHRAASSRVEHGRGVRVDGQDPDTFICQAGAGLPPTPPTIGALEHPRSPSSRIDRSLVGRVDGQNSDISHIQPDARSLVGPGQ